MSRPAWRDAPLAGPVLVTGATGFYGGAIVDALLARGAAVIATGRRLDIGASLSARGARFLPVDLNDRAALYAATAGCAAVVHAGALAVPWAPEPALHRANVLGTQNVADACVAHDVERLIYISSPAVTSRFADQLDQRESDPPPARFVSGYARTKYDGELIARRARPDAVILRPKAMYGVGDPTIIPRILDAARRGRLVQLDGRRPITQLTHVRDAARAVIHALLAPDAPGGTFVIAGDERIDLFAVIARLLAPLGITPPTRSVSLSRAMAVAHALEAAYERLPLRGVPAVTPYTLGMLAFSQTYDTSAAREKLAFTPEVRLDDGLAEYLASCGGTPREAPPIAATASVAAQPRGASKWARPPVERSASVAVLRAGCVRQISRFFLPDGNNDVIDIPALFGAIVHPTEGVVLFDTGYSPRFHDATARLPARLYRVATPVSIPEHETAWRQLQARGIAPNDVRWIVLSHFDPDHYGGLADFPRATFVVDAAAWAHVRGRSGLAALQARLLPGHLPDDFAARLRLIHDYPGESIAPFGGSVDLFGDRSVRIVALPGHAPGHLGAFVRRDDGAEIFFAADGCWSRASLAGCDPRPGFHAWIAHNLRQQRLTYRQLQALRVLRPNTIIVPSHCPDAAAELVNATPTPN